MLQGKSLLMLVNASPIIFDVNNRCFSCAKAVDFIIKNISADDEKALMNNKLANEFIDLVNHLTHNKFNKTTIDRARRKALASYRVYAVIDNQQKTA